MPKPNLAFTIITAAALLAACGNDEDAKTTPETTQTTVSVDEEPAGSNCAAGGTRITTSDGSVHYVCNAASEETTTTATLCPSGTSAGDSGTRRYYATFDAQAQGQLTTELTMPDGTPNAVALDAVCYSAGMTINETTGIPTNQLVSTPLGIVMQIGPLLPQLYTIANNKEDVLVEVYAFANDETNVRVLEHTITLADAKLTGIELLTANSPDEPTQRVPYLRLWSSAETLSFEQGTTSVSTSEGSTTMAPLASTCLATDEVLAQATLTLAQFGEVTANGAIDVWGLCHGIVTSYDGNGTAGANIHRPFVIIKQSDATTGALLHALWTEDLASPLVVSFPPTTLDGVALTITLDDAQVVSFESFEERGTGFERIGFYYDTLSLSYGPRSAELSAP